MSGNEDAVAGPSNVESTPKLFRLNDDCFYEIFEYLCVKDLYSFGQTCKRMNELAGEYFKKNHSAATNYFQRHEIYTANKYATYISGKLWNAINDKPLFDLNGTRPIQAHGFKKFMPSFSIYYHVASTFKYIKSHTNEFESSKHIYFCSVSFRNRDMKYFKKLWPQIEIVHINFYKIRGDFYDMILKHCTNLRQLHVEDCNLGSRKLGKYKWLLQKYSKLEFLRLEPDFNGRFEELREFFLCNPNLRRFSTTARFFWEHGDIFLNSNVKLDILELTIGKKSIFYSWYSTATTTSKTLVELLNRLHERGFYTRLYVYNFITEEEVATKLTLVRGLDFVYVREFSKIYNLHQLTNLRELIIKKGTNGRDMEILANNLTRLERLCIYGPRFDDIMPFIRRSLKLQKILFISTEYGVVLNLAMLNAERAKLYGTRKIIIYVRDDSFLATKWTTKNGDTNLDFIEMRRSESIQWNHHFI